MHSLQNNTLTANNPPTPLPNFLNFPNSTNIHTHGLHISSVVSKVDFKLDHIFIHVLPTNLANFQTLRVPLNFSNSLTMLWKSEGKACVQFLSLVGHETHTSSITSFKIVSQISDVLSVVVFYRNVVFIKNLITGKRFWSIESSGL